MAKSKKIDKDMGFRLKKARLDVTRRIIVPTYCSFTAD